MTTQEHELLHARREGAVQKMLEQPCPKITYGKEVETRRAIGLLNALVIRDDSVGLARHLESWREGYDAGRVCHSLWHLALLEGKAKTFELLCNLAKEKTFAFPLVASLDQLPHDLQMWALAIPVARNLWLSKTEPLSAQRGYKNVNGLRFLEHNADVVQLHEHLNTKPSEFHERMRLFIDEFGMQTLMQNGTFLHTIAYYKEPSKKHLRVAATGVQPVYDLERMEKYWPGIAGCVTAFGGLGLSSEDCEARIRKIISNKQARQMQVQTQAYELPSGLVPE